MEHPVKSKKYANFSSKYDFTAEAIRRLESLAPNEHLPPVLEGLQNTLKACQEGMAKLLDSEYRAMQREAKRHI